MSPRPALIPIGEVVGSRLTEIRKEQGYSTHKLCDALNDRPALGWRPTFTTINRIEHGERPLRAKEAGVLTELFEGVDVEDFLPRTLSAQDRAEGVAAALEMPLIAVKIMADVAGMSVEEFMETLNASADTTRVRQLPSKLRTPSKTRAANVRAAKSATG